MLDRTALLELPADRPNVYTVDVAPSDVSRLYVTATSTAAGIVVTRAASDRERPDPRRQRVQLSSCHRSINVLFGLAF